MSGQQIQFSKIQLCHFSIHGKISLKVKKTYTADPEKNMSKTNGQTDSWTAKQDRFYRTPFTKMEV